MQLRYNLEYTVSYHGHTVMEYLTIEVPRTHRDIVRPMDVPDILGDVDDQFIEQLRALLLEQNTLLDILRVPMIMLDTRLWPETLHRRVNT